MKTLLAATAALALLAAPVLAADNPAPSPDAGKSTNSDGTAGKGADGAATGTSGNDAAPGKSTNSDGSTGAAANAPGTSINDGAGSTSDQKPASGADKNKY
jgi:hypothetical protein